MTGNIKTRSACWLIKQHPMMMIMIIRGIIAEKRRHQPVLFLRQGCNVQYANIKGQRTKEPNNESRFKFKKEKHNRNKETKLKERKQPRHKLLLLINQTPRVVSDSQN